MFFFIPEFHGNTASDNRADTPERPLDPKETNSDITESDIDKLKCNLMNQLNFMDDNELRSSGLTDTNINGTSGFRL